MSQTCVFLYSHAHFKPLWAVAGLCLLLSGCASRPTEQTQLGVQALPAWMQSSAWEHQTFRTKNPTHYQASRILGREALQARAVRSMSVMRKRISIAPQDVGQLQFSWLAKEALAQADMSVREADDGVLRVVLTFEGDRSQFSAKNQMLSDLALGLTGEELPYATMMYVWSKKKPVGSVIVNPRTDRIRKLVVESGPSRNGQWLDYSRDIRADYQHAFGEMPGKLTSIAFMTDTDNTQSETTAWYGPVSLR